MTRIVTQMIEGQIAEELRKLNSIMTDEEDKPAIMQRIADLKAMLDTSPQVIEEPQPPTFRDLVQDFIYALRRR